MSYIYTTVVQSFLKKELSIRLPGMNGNSNPTGENSSERESNSRLVKTTSVPVDGNNIIVAATQVFILRVGATVTSYDATTGATICELRGPFDEDKLLWGEISKYRNEIFLAGAGITIKAFCLEEPQVT